MQWANQQSWQKYATGAKGGKKCVTRATIGFSRFWLVYVNLGYSVRLFFLDRARSTSEHMILFQRPVKTICDMLPKGLHSYNFVSFVSVIKITNYKDCSRNLKSVLLSVYYIDTPG